MVVPTVSNYNAFDAPRMFAFFDEHGLPFSYNVVSRPERLNLLNLPPPVRREAAARLLRYAAHTRTGGRRVATMYADLLLAEGERFDESLFREFMLFTNDLDATRNQRFADADPELAAQIAAAGIEWIPDLHHAR